MLSSFTLQYYSFANTIQDAVEVHTQNLFGTMRTASNSITGASVTTNRAFPYVTVPAFEILGEGVRRQSGAEWLIYAPKVEESQVERWNLHATANQGWYDESKTLAVALSEGSLTSSDYAPGGLMPFIYDLTIDENGNPVPMTSQNGPFYPLWQMSPPPFDPFLLKGNINAQGDFDQGLKAVNANREAVLSRVPDIAGTELAVLASLVLKPEEHESYHAQFVTSDTESAFAQPHAMFFQPVFSAINEETSEVSGVIAAIIAWDRYFANLLPKGVKGITCVLENTCGQAYTYNLDGNKVSIQVTLSARSSDALTWSVETNPCFCFLQAFYAGEGDLHVGFDSMKVEIPFSDFLYNSTKDAPSHCVYTFVVYPTKELQENYESNLHVVMTCVVAATFFFMIVTFLVYDRFVQRRNSKVVGAAARSNVILASLFPKNIRQRLYADREIAEQENKKKATNGSSGTKVRLKTFLDDEYGEFDGEVDDDFMYKSKPIADLFPETTILFADISGFTAWSSVREPTQVFILLETIYKAFDEIAKRRGVFKVETIGDCYVAVTGLPEPRKDHAVAMTRFARDCMHRMHVLVKKLEVTLGPDTAQLSMRFGLHSGPVTAGVLRGERSRFQLFGDTMNTASRMESTGARDKIQISQQTANLLVEAGKTSWITPRTEKVIAKGKGEMQTYWVAVSVKQGSSNSCVESSSSNLLEDALNDLDASSNCQLISAKTIRLVKWNVDVLKNLLVLVQARRDDTVVLPTEKECLDTSSDHHTLLDEVKEIIHLPTYNGGLSKDPTVIKLDPIVLGQLEEYVTAVASMYRDNPFHNFEHASHVTMSVVKLLSRIVAPDLQQANGKDMGSTLHDHTYGITSDPLTQFACVFSALIHDVDHAGVPNSQLIKENSLLSKVYKKKSVAEQNSVDLAWDLLMDNRFETLRGVIYSTSAEKKRFRQLVVNSVMATDIMDKDLKQLRNNRWNRAFGAENRSESEEDSVDRKATIVIEHLIQASDIAHTMQHWHVYRKWNARLFEESYMAFLEGRAEKDPSEIWYEGEIGFFDFYIIPLAKKLKDCGVFGVSSDEYLTYAMQNRQEWEERGHQVVAELKEAAHGKVPRTAKQRGERGG
jgi:class 3 adenylate cyclase